MSHREHRLKSGCIVVSELVEGFGGRPPMRWYQAHGPFAASDASQLVDFMMTELAEISEGESGDTISQKGRPAASSPVEDSAPPALGSPDLTKGGGGRCRGLVRAGSGIDRRDGRCAREEGHAGMCESDYDKPPGVPKGGGSEPDRDGLHLCFCGHQRQQHDDGSQNCFALVGDRICPCNTFDRAKVRT